MFLYILYAIHTFPQFCKHRELIYVVMKPWQQDVCVCWEFYGWDFIHHGWLMVKAMLFPFVICGKEKCDSLACLCSFLFLLEAVACPPLNSSLLNGFTSGSSSTTFGTSVTFTCKTGYFITGKQAADKKHVLTCGSHRQWNGSEPTCSGKHQNAFVELLSTVWDAEKVEDKEKHKEFE